MSESMSPHARLRYDGRIGEMYVIFLTNLIYTILTFGIYRFWAKTRERRYFLSRMELMGDRLEYTGTGGELFRGFLVVFLLIISPLIGLQLAAQFVFIDQPDVVIGLNVVVAVLACGSGLADRPGPSAVGRCRRMD